MDLNTYLRYNKAYGIHINEDGKVMFNSTKVRKHMIREDIVASEEAAVVDGVSTKELLDGIAAQAKIDADNILKDTMPGTMLYEGASERRHPAQTILLDYQGNPMFKPNRIVMALAATAGAVLPKILADSKPSDILQFKQLISTPVSTVLDGDIYPQDRFTIEREITAARLAAIDAKYCITPHYFNDLDTPILQVIIMQEKERGMYQLTMSHLRQHIVAKEETWFRLRGDERSITLIPVGADFVPWLSCCIGEGGSELVNHLDYVSDITYRQLPGYSNATVQLLFTFLHRVELLCNVVCTLSTEYDIQKLIVILECGKGMLVKPDYCSALVSDNISMFNQLIEVLEIYDAVITEDKLQVTISNGNNFEMSIDLLEPL